MQQIRRAINVMKNIKDPKLSYHFQRQMSLYDRSYQMRMYVHWMLFRETIWAQGTKEQFAEWEPLIRDMKVIGTSRFSVRSARAATNTIT
jgi:acyl-CoA oxidase